MANVIGNLEVTGGVDSNKIILANGGVRFPEWTTLTPYNIGDTVLKDGGLITVTTSHTSGLDFDAEVSNWFKVGKYTAPKVRLFLSSDDITPAIPDTPSTSEVQAVISPVFRGIVYYTGTTVSTEDPTYVFDVDDDGNVTLIYEPPYEPPAAEVPLPTPNTWGSVTIVANGGNVESESTISVGSSYPTYQNVSDLTVTLPEAGVYEISTMLHVWLQLNSQNANAYYGQLYGRFYDLTNGTELLDSRFFHSRFNTILSTSNSNGADGIIISVDVVKSSIMHEVTEATTIVLQVARGAAGPTNPAIYYGGKYRGTKLSFKKID